MNAHLITGEKNNEPRIGVCDMFSTNIVTVNNFYKRLASVFIAIMMMTSMLVACGKKEDIVHSQECNVIVEIGSSGYNLGSGNQDLTTYTFSEEELGSNEEIRQCLKQFINDNENADVVVAEYFFDGKYEDTAYELRGFYATNEKCYSYYITVSADDDLTKELYELLKEECKKKEKEFEYVVLNLSAENELQHGSDVQIGTVEWCESHIMTNKELENKIISYVKKWTQVDDIESIIIGSFHRPADDSYSIFAKVDGKWYEGYKWEGYTKMPLTDAEFDEIGTFSSKCLTEYYNSDFYEKEMGEFWTSIKED